MNANVTLVEEHIIDCNWGVGGGSLEYDISHIDPSLDTLIQSYIVESIDYEGKFIYGSEFQIYKQGESSSTILKNYSKEIRIAIWQTVFAIKWKFFEDVKPDVVLHFIKQPHIAEKRYQIYKKYFRPPGYTVELDKIRHEIIYTKETSTGNGGGFTFTAISR